MTQKISNLSQHPQEKWIILVMKPIELGVSPISKSQREKSLTCKEPAEKRHLVDLSFIDRTYWSRLK